MRNRTFGEVCEYQAGHNVYFLCVVTATANSTWPVLGEVWDPKSVAAGRNKSPNLHCYECCEWPENSFKQINFKFKLYCLYEEVCSSVSHLPYVTDSSLTSSKHLNVPPSFQRFTRLYWVRSVKLRCHLWDQILVFWIHAIVLIEKL
jgi:hypothetical protein